MIVFADSAAHRIHRPHTRIQSFLPGDADFGAAIHTSLADVSSRFRVLKVAGRQAKTLQHGPLSILQTLNRGILFISDKYRVFIASDGTILPEARPLGAFGFPEGERRPLTFNLLAKIEGRRL